LNLATVNPLSLQVTSSSAFKIIVEKSGIAPAARGADGTEEVGSGRLPDSGSAGDTKEPARSKNPITGLPSTADALITEIPTTSRAYIRCLVLFGSIGQVGLW
jgi:hypothetical protein